MESPSGVNQSTLKCCVVPLSHVDGFGPHSAGNPKNRPDWFFEKEKYGGILCDIGSHQIEQFLFYCGVKDAKGSAASHSVFRRFHGSLASSFDSISHRLFNRLFRGAIIVYFTLTACSSALGRPADFSGEM